MSIGQYIETGLNWAGEKIDTGLKWAGEQVKTGARTLLNEGSDALVSLISAVNEVMPNMLPTVAACLATLSYRGSQGNFASISYPVVLTATFLDISGTNPRKFGYPCCKSRPIEDLSGFCLTQHAQFHISGTVIEEEALEALFNAGVILDWSGS